MRLRGRQLNWVSLVMPLSTRHLHAASGVALASTALLLPDPSAVADALLQLEELLALDKHDESPLDAT